MRTGGERVIGIPAARPSGGGGPLRAKEGCCESLHNEDGRGCNDSSRGFARGRVGAFGTHPPISTQTRDTRLQYDRSFLVRTGGERVIGIPVARPSGGGGPLRAKEDAASHSFREGGDLRGACRIHQINRGT